MGHVLVGRRCLCGVRVYRRVARELVCVVVRRHDRVRKKYLHVIPSPHYCRFPFYWETKTVILLFLALPQTQASVPN